MSTKAIQARVIIEKPEELTALWQVHSVFNQYLSKEVIKPIFAMHRGEFGPECQSIAVNIIVVSLSNITILLLRTNRNYSAFMGSSFRLAV